MCIRDRDYASKAITAFNKDDGQEIGPLAWSADAGAIVFVRGTGPNRAGEIPNPTSDPVGAEQAVWIVPAAGGEAKKLGEGSAPEVSKSGRVAWIWKGQVWSASADGSAKANQLFKARGTASSLRWSPEGNKLAFVSE